jgi:predicted AlkP superfamily phosphohydrolase/phosphomutase
MAGPGCDAPRRRLLVLGLDGADWSVLRPLLAAGRLPNLGRWLDAGSAAPLPSTVPAMSFPAWTSFATGLGPGAHGVFDFTQRLPATYRLRFVNAADRAGASLWGRVAVAGGTVLCLGVPATYPPERLEGGGGLLVPGFDAPVSTGSEARATSDPGRYARIARRAGPWMRADLDEGARRSGWHDAAVAALLARVDRKTAFALEALRTLRDDGHDPQLAVVVFSESDTVAHHFWRDHDPASPRHDPAASAVRRGALAAVYERLDAAAGALRAAFGEDAPCVVLSDHGQGGASRRVVHLNRRLADCGLLEPAPRRAAGRLASRSAGWIRDAALGTLPPRAAEVLFRQLRGPAARVESLARFGGFERGRTVAFSEEANTQPGVWIHLRGRDPEGIVAPADYESVRQAVIDALLDWKLPPSSPPPPSRKGPGSLGQETWGGGADGAPVVARARRREEVYDGPFVARAPDVVVELALEAGYAHSLVPTPWDDPRTAAVRTLAAAELGGGRGRGMNGTHRPDGIWLAVGGVAGGPPSPPASIAAVAPALLALLGLAPDAEGCAPCGPAPYDAAQEARVAARLRALGYLE